MSEPGVPNLVNIAKASRICGTFALIAASRPAASNKGCGLLPLPVTMIALTIFEPITAPHADAARHAGFPTAGGDGGKQDLLLAGGSDAGAHRALAELRRDGVFHLVDVLAPPVVARAERDIVAVDDKRDRLRGLVGEDDAVDTGQLQLPGEGAAGVRFTVEAGKRRQRDHLETRIGRRHGRVQRAGHEDKRVLRPQGVGGAIRHAGEYRRAEVGAADELAGVSFTDGAELDLPAGQIDPSDPVMESIHGFVSFDDSMMRQRFRLLAQKMTPGPAGADPRATRRQGPTPSRKDKRLPPRHSEPDEV